MSLEVLVGVLAIIVAFLLFWKHDKDIKTVNNQIPTRYIAKFPDNFHDIIKIIKDAQRTIRIVTDVPAYGIFSSPETYWEFRDCLQKQKGDKCDIILVVYDKTQMEIGTHEQFKKADEELYRSSKTINFLKVLKKNYLDRSEERRVGKEC